MPKLIRHNILSAIIALVLAGVNFALSALRMKDDDDDEGGPGGGLRDHALRGEHAMIPIRVESDRAGSFLGKR